MARNADVFGFDELEKAFNRLERRYPDEADRLLMAEGQAVNKETKRNTPVYKGKISPKSRIKPGQLKKSWRLKKVKLYKGGTVRVVRVQSDAPHAHLIELGYEVVHGGKARANGRKLNRVQRSVRGIKSGGYVEGKFILEKSMAEAQQRFDRNAQNMINKLTEDVKV